MQRRDRHIRKTGAKLCSVARCPNKLGDLPWAFCSEHLPAVLEDQHLSKVEARRQMPWQAQLEARIMAMFDDGKAKTTAALLEQANASTGAVSSVLHSLVEGGRIVKVKPGVYREVSR